MERENFTAQIPLAPLFFRTRSVKSSINQGLRKASQGSKKREA